MFLAVTSGSSCIIIMYKNEIFIINYLRKRGFIEKKRSFGSL